MFAMAMAMVVAVTVTVAISMVVLVEECSTDEIQGQTDAAYYQNQLRVLHMLEGDETLDRLQRDAQPQSKEESAVEECTEKLSTSPTEREIGRRLLAFRNLHCY